MFVMLAVSFYQYLSADTMTDIVISIIFLFSFYGISFINLLIWYIYVSKQYLRSKLVNILLNMSDYYRLFKHPYSATRMFSFLHS